MKRRAGGIPESCNTMRPIQAARSLPLCALILILAVRPALAEDEAEQSAIIVTANPVVEAAAARVQRTPGGVDVVAAEA